MADEPRLLVFGAGGQLGQALRGLNRPGLGIVGLDRAEADITSPPALHRALARHRPQIVVNAAAYTAVDRAETEREACLAVNRDGAGNVADACARACIPVIHVSTDYVFDGAGSRPWREEDPIAPLNHYGASKAAGEALVAAATRRHVILRSAWLFGPHGRNFLGTVRRLAAKGEALRIVADQVGSPTPAAALAEAIATIARRIAAGAGVWGVFHFGGQPAASWHALAEAIVAAVPADQKRPPVLPITTADYPTAARRPAMSVLDCARIAAAYGIASPDWRASVAAGAANIPSISAS